MNKLDTIKLFLIALLFFANSNLYAGNTCNTATPLPNNMVMFSSYSTIGNTASGTAAPGCGTFSSTTPDIWFSTTVGTNGELDIVTLAGSMTDAAMTVYTGSCAGLTELACASSDNCGSGTQMPIMQFDGLTPNMPVYIRIWSETGGVGTFEIRVSAGDPPGIPLPFDQMNGTAMQSGDCIQLTGNVGNSIGCVWNSTPIDFTNAFTKEFMMNFGICLDTSHVLPSIF